MTAAVDGKTAKQIKDADGEPLLMLNVFVHDIKVTLAEWSVKGDKTNEPGCLKQHPGELLQKYPQLKILTGDAIDAQRTVRRNKCTLSCDTHYYISSLDLSERSPGEILALLRGREVSP